MSTYRLAIVDRCRLTGCLELQKLVTNERGQPEWVHYCIVVSAAQAVQVVAEKEPEMVAIATADLAGGEVLDSAKDPAIEVRIAKHLRAWKDAEPVSAPQAKISGFKK